MMSPALSVYIAVDCMREMLLEGKKIRLGDLGDFSLLLTSKGAEDADKFTSQNITGVKVQWEPGQEFKNLRDDAEFNLVASRSAHKLRGLRGRKAASQISEKARKTADNTVCSCACDKPCGAFVYRQTVVQ